MISDIADRYTVCGAADVLDELQRRDYAAVISIEHPGADGAERAPRLAALGYDVQQVILPFWGYRPDGVCDLSAEQAVSALELFRKCRGQNMLVHCKKGTSRSAGIALMGIADEMGAGCEQGAVSLLKQIRPACVPNYHVVNIADRLLNRSGKLLAAVRENADIRARLDTHLAEVRESMRKRGQGTVTHLGY